MRVTTPGVRYTRGNAGPGGVRRGEHALEYEILAPSPWEQPAACLGARLLDGVNAVPLAKDPGGGRAGNVEADMLLLVEAEDGPRHVLVEVKAERGTAWYATVENLRQLRLFTESPASQRIFKTRGRGPALGDGLPVTAIVLAPPAFYASPGAKTAAVAPAQSLLRRMRAEAGIDARLTTWDPTRRTIEEL